MVLEGPYLFGWTIEIQFKKRQFLKFGYITPVAKEHAACVHFALFWTQPLLLMTYETL